MDEKGNAMMDHPPRVPHGVYRGLLFALPPSLAFWALIIWAMS